MGAEAQEGYVRWLLAVQWEDLPRAVQTQVKRCLRDIVGTAVGALALPVARQSEAFVATQFGAGAVPLWFRGNGSSSTGAAFCNALTIDSLDCHDGFRPTKGHAGATVVPVAIGACVGHQFSGAELLTAIALGYEVACRAGLVVHQLHADACPSSGVWAALGAAAAGGRLLGIPEVQFDQTLGLAEYYAPISPLLRCTASPSVVKDGAGAGAWAGAMALAMHAHGMHGLPSLFTAEPLGRAQAATLGHDWMILRQYFKAYPTCRWTQPAVEGVRLLQRECGFAPREIARIDIETFQEGADLTHFPPEHSDGAQYCTPWAVAAMLVDGELGVNQILPIRLSDPAILDLGRRVATHVAPDLVARFPAECLARVAITLRDGSRLESPTMAARGDWEAPLSEEELGDKFRGLVEPVLGSAAYESLAAVLETLEQRPACDLLGALSQAPEPKA